MFYDGPPFANGLPHYGHLLTGYVKDVVPRYQTMRGQRVERRFGWDTHGLPAELEAERILGITDKSQIEEMGIAAFNAACRESVLRYTGEWETYVTRQARWVDFENDYKTLDLTFMESVLWAFKQLYDKGLAYEGYRVLPYCWRDETPLSNHELRMDDDVYAERQDRAVTVTFPLEGDALEALGLTGRRAGLDDHAVDPADQPGARGGPGHRVRRGAARGRTGALAGEQGPDRRRSGWPPTRAELGDGYAGDGACRGSAPVGAELAGLRYRRLFGLLRRRHGANAWQCWSTDYVTTEDGTGIVHDRPGLRRGRPGVLRAARASRRVLPVDAGGRFTSVVPDFAGQQVFDANPAIIRRPQGEAGRPRCVRESTATCTPTRTAGGAGTR